MFSRRCALVVVVLLGIVLAPGCGDADDPVSTAKAKAEATASQLAARKVAVRKRVIADYYASCAGAGGRSQTCREQLGGKHTWLWNTTEARVRGKRAARRQRTRQREAYMAACVAASAADLGCRSGWSNYGSESVWGKDSAAASTLGQRRGAKLVAAAQPEPPAPPEQVPSTPETTTPPEPEDECDASYEGSCLDPNAYDYDCAGGSGDGPEYVDGPVSVVGDDHFRLDADGNGVGCE